MRQLAHEVAIWVLQDGIACNNNLADTRVLLNFFNLSVTAVAVNQYIDLRVVELACCSEHATESRR